MIDDCFFLFLGALELRSFCIISAITTIFAFFIFVEVYFGLIFLYWVCFICRVRYKKA